MKCSKNAYLSLLAQQATDDDRGSHYDIPSFVKKSPVRLRLPDMHEMHDDQSRLYG
ncbi:MAG: hypothetical protein RL295_669 [Pseudomonadota bacterium]